MPFPAAPVTSIACSRKTLIVGFVGTVIAQHVAQAFPKPLSFVPDPSDPSLYEEIRAFLLGRTDDEGRMKLDVGGTMRDVHLADGGREYVTLHLSRLTLPERASEAYTREALPDQIIYGC
ncbi:hypothetical protein L0Y59_01255 [Candidatus Uhrbacteria bacterium]|nr:hypothetical protein [Candidatus Uhrbacteria bacterium]